MECSQDPGELVLATALLQCGADGDDAGGGGIVLAKQVRVIGDSDEVIVAEVAGP